MRKKLVTLLLTSAMICGVLAGCGNSEESPSSAQTDGSGVGSQTDNSSSADGEESSDNEEDGEITEVTFYMCDIAGIGSENVSHVEEALNAITEEQINVHVNLNLIEVGEYSTQVNLAITSKDKIDMCMLMPVPGSGMSSMVGNNQLMGLNDLLKEYGQGIVDTMGVYLDAGTVAGTYYEIPAYRLYSSKLAVIMRKDILEELDMVELAQNMTTWAEFEQILAAVAENYDVAPIGGANGAVFVNDVVYIQGDNFSDAVTFDTLGSEAFFLSTDENGKVYSLTGTDNFKNSIYKVKEWWDKGWVYKDNPTATEQNAVMMKQNLIFASVNTIELGAEASWLANTGYDVVITDIVPNSVTTQHVNKFGLGIPVTAEEPEAAMKFMNLMYTSQDVMNLLDWGVEGTDFVMKDGEATYPDGVDADSVAYHNRDFLLGNYFLAAPWTDNGYGSDFRQVAMDELKSAPVSRYLGFNADVSALTNEITAVTNVINEYINNIRSGAFDDALYEEFQNALDEAGMQTIVNEYQKQLDEWLAGKDSSEK